MYDEAYVTVYHYDSVLDVTVINQSKVTLQNLCLELVIIGDLKLGELSQNYTLSLESSKQIKANIKVSSTETGVILENILSGFEVYIVGSDIRIGCIPWPSAIFRVNLVTSLSQPRPFSCLNLDNSLSRFGLIAQRL
ncbi:Coatomer beta subunit (COPB1) [Cynara cardunculus var. scolymus]|uniref:Coatomer beta subunit (COPB1) n=1 Tax=Cynara cardunculus var. scolymus TaxID=59895 RepID=A0A103XBA7_CYNCS|nr:Coatomer beta subunit (COPB1) [Cynara cardunculus var. scolymus]